MIVITNDMSDVEVFRLTKYAYPVYHPENGEWDICLSVNQTGAIWTKKSFETEAEADAYVVSLKEAIK